VILAVKMRKNLTVCARDKNCFRSDLNDIHGIDEMGQNYYFTEMCSYFFARNNCIVKQMKRERTAAKIDGTDLSLFQIPSLEAWK